MDEAFKLIGKLKFTIISYYLTTSGCSNVLIINQHLLMFVTFIEEKTLNWWINEMLCMGSWIN